MTTEERYQAYLNRYARDYCDGDTTVAAGHAIVRSYRECLEEDERTRLHKKR